MPAFSRARNIEAFWELTVEGDAGESRPARWLWPRALTFSSHLPQVVLVKPWRATQTHVNPLEGTRQIFVQILATSRNSRDGSTPHLCRNPRGRTAPSPLCWPMIGAVSRPAPCVAREIDHPPAILLTAARQDAHRPRGLRASTYAPIHKYQSVSPNPVSPNP